MRAMMHSHNRLFVSGALALGLVCVLGEGKVDILAQTSHDVTEAMVEQWMTELSNWGRWGDDDQLGALNLITPEKRKRAAALVREGISVSMSHDYLTERAADATSPFEHEMLGVASGGPFVSDRYSMGVGPRLTRIRRPFAAGKGRRCRPGSHRSGRPMRPDSTRGRIAGSGLPSGKSGSLVRHRCSTASPTA